MPGARSNGGQSSTRLPPEVRARVARMALELSEIYVSQWAEMSSIASKIGCTAESLRRWVRQVEDDQGQRTGATTYDRARLKALEREVH